MQSQKSSFTRSKGNVCDPSLQVKLPLVPSYLHMQCNTPPIFTGISLSHHRIVTSSQAGNLPHDNAAAGSTPLGSPFAETKVAMLSTSSSEGPRHGEKMFICPLRAPAMYLPKARKMLEREQVPTQPSPFCVHRHQAPRSALAKNSFHQDGNAAFTPSSRHAQACSTIQAGSTLQACNISPAALHYAVWKQHWATGQWCRKHADTR